MLPPHYVNKSSVDFYSTVVVKKEKFYKCKKIYTIKFFKELVPTNVDPE